jgi:hypothetical protein
MEEGGFLAPSHFQVFVWTLVDSDENKEGAPPLSSHGSLERIFDANSLKMDELFHKIIRDLCADFVLLNDAICEDI